MSISSRASSPPRGLPGKPASTPRLDGRVLVVDDTEAKRYLVAQTLRMAGMEVLEAASGQESLSAAALLPDVVVLDVRLPDISGFEVCRQLKENPTTAAIPILYISTLLRDEEFGGAALRGWRGRVHSAAHRAQAPGGADLGAGADAPGGAGPPA